MMDVGFCLPNANATGRTCAVASPKLESVHLGQTQALEMCRHRGPELL